MNIKLCLGASSIIALAVSACADDPNSLLGKRGAAGPNDGEDGAGEEGARSLQCTTKPEGRTYTNFNGAHLEESRVNENVGVNRARIKPYAVMASEYQRVLGLVPDALKTAGGSFDDPPQRWYAESTYSGVSMNTIFEISFAGCLTHAKAAADLKAAPTPESAAAECTRLMRKAWNRAPSPEETQGCTDLAMTKLASQPDVSRRWAYVCASVLSSSQFLTF